MIHKYLDNVILNLIFYSYTKLVEIRYCCVLETNTFLNESFPLLLYVISDKVFKQRTIQLLPLEIFCML